MVVSEVKNLRRSNFDADHGKLPIQTPNSDRLDGWVNSTWSSVELGSSTMAVDFDEDLSDTFLPLPFLALRSAFFEGGSGAAMSTSSSSMLGPCLFRFLDDGGGEVDVELDVRSSLAMRVWSQQSV